MKKLENFLRRVLSVVLSISMLLGNMGGALAAGTSNTVDLSTQLADSSSVSANIEFVGINKAGYNTPGIYDDNKDDTPKAYFRVNVSVQGVVSELGIGLNMADVHNNDKNGIAVEQNGSTLNGANAYISEASGFKTVFLSGNLTGEYEVIVKMPLHDDTVRKMVSGSGIGYKIAFLRVGGGREEWNNASEKKIVANTSATLTPSLCTTHGGKHIMWTLHYTNDIMRLGNTSISAVIDQGTILDYKGHNTSNLSGDDLTAFVNTPVSGDRNVLNARQTVAEDRKSIVFEGLYDDKSAGNVYSTDLTIRFYSELPAGEQPVLNVSVYPELDIASNNTPITMTASTFMSYDVALEAVRESYGAESAVDISRFDLYGMLIENNYQWGDSALLANVDGAPNKKAGSVAYKVAQNVANPSLVISTDGSTSQSKMYADGSQLELDLNGDNTITDDEIFDVSIPNNSTVKLVNHYSPIQKTGEMVFVNNEPCIQWQIVLGGATRVVGAELTDTLSSGSKLLVDQNHPFTIKGLQDQVRTCTNSGNLHNDLRVYKNGDSEFAVTLTQDENFFNNQTTEEARQIVVTYYSTLPTDADGNPVDPATVVNTVTAAGRELVSAAPESNAKNYQVVASFYTVEGEQKAEYPLNSAPTVYVATVNAETKQVTGIVSKLKLQDGKLVGKVFVADGNEDPITLLVPASSSDPDKLKADYDASRKYRIIGNEKLLNADSKFFKLTKTNTSVVESRASEAVGTATFELENSKAADIEGLTLRSAQKVYLNPNPGEFTSSDPIFPGGYDYTAGSALGIAGNFHVVAFDTAEVIAHTNGNVLANTLKGNGHTAEFGTHGLAANEVSYIQHFTNVGSLQVGAQEYQTRQLLVVGKDVELGIGTNNNITVDGATVHYPSNIMVDADGPFIDLGALESQVTSYSSSLQHEDCGVSVTKQGGSSKIQLLDPDSTGYLNITAAELANLGGGSKIDGFKSGHNGAVVINVDCTGVSDIYTPNGDGITIVVDGDSKTNGEYVEHNFGRVIFNFINAEGKTIHAASTVFGMMLAPGATIIAEGGVNGSMIADNVIIRAESHRVTFAGGLSPAQAYFSAWKKLDDKDAEGSDFSFYLQQVAYESNQVTTTAPVTVEDVNTNEKKAAFNIVDIQNNADSYVKFDNIPPFNQAGTYYYRIGELEGTNNTNKQYTYDTTCYYVKVTVTASTNNGDTVLSTGYEYFSDSRLSQPIEDISTIVFNNYTKKENITLSGQKTWVDYDYKDEYRPASITVKVMVGEQVIRTQEVTADNDWKYTFADLPGDVSYKIVEEPVPGYTLTYGDSAYDLVNTLETVNVSGMKRWFDDYSVTSTARPTSITLKLLRDGQYYDEMTVYSNGSNGWSYAFNNLPKYKPHTTEPYSYTVEEVSVPGYSTTYEGTAINNTLITTEVAGTKTWVDNNADMRPDSIKVTLQKTVNGTTTNVETKDISSDDQNNWNWKWEKLPTYEYVDNIPYEVTYSVVEERVPYYETTYSGYNITNTLKLTSLEGSKTWAGEHPDLSIRPESIRVSLLRNDKEIAFRTVTPNESGEWKWSFSNLLAEDASGNPYTYKVKETVVPGYTPTVSADGKNITNTLITTDVTVKKVWEHENRQPTAIQVQLKAGDTNIGEAVTLKDDVWTHTWSGLPAVDAEGNEIVYTVDEISVPDGYVKTVANNNNSYIITNTFVKDTQAVIEATKTLIGKQLEAEQFSFELKDSEGNVLKSAKNDGEGNVTFPALTYKLADMADAVNGVKTYNYTISEVPANAEGYIYDTNSYDVTVTVTQGADKQLTAVVTYKDGAKPVFTNYYVNDTQALIEATKTLNGKQLEAEQFSFELKDSKGNVLYTAKNDGAGNVTFPYITYKLADMVDAVNGAKTFTYSIREIPGEAGKGITYDATEYTVTVTVTQGDDKQLTAVVNYPDNVKPTFENTYETAPAVVVIPVKKTLVVGEGLDTPDILDKYEFTITGVVEGTNEAAPLPSPATIRNTTGNSMSFAEFSITKPGTYVYTITESGTVPGITNDRDATNGKKVTVTVTDNGEGKLVVTDLTADENGKYTTGAVTFTNRYELGKITVQIPVVKEMKLNGFTGPASIENQFTFKLEAITEGAPMPTNGLVEITGPAANNAEVCFGEIEYTKPDTFQYKVTEVAGDMPGVTYDNTDSIVTVTITEDKVNGRLLATVIGEGGDAAKFENEYNAEPAVAQIPVQKNLVNELNRDELPDITGEFTFEISGVFVAEGAAADTAVPAPNPENGTSFTNDDGSEMIFKNIKFEKAGTYVYTITESGTVPGITNDPDAITGKTVTVTVTDNGEGKLVVTGLTADENGKYTTDAVTFTNTYRAGEAKLPIPVTKTLTVAEGQNGPTASVEDAFTFTLAAVDGTPMPAAGGEVVTISLVNGQIVDGEKSFGEITYDMPGTYTYTITETANVPGVSVSAPITVTVDVTDDVNNGQLVATMKVNGQTVTQVPVVNHYEAQPDYITIDVTKSYVSEPADLEKPSISGKYKFTITGENGAPMPAVSEVTYELENGMAKDMSFGAIEFTKADTYIYTISEAVVNEAVPGVTMDNTVKTVTVVVTDDGRGNLTATSSEAVNDVVTVSFTNTYKVGEVETDIPVKKIFQVAEGAVGPDITGKFAFTLTPVNGAPMPAGSVEGENGLYKTVYNPADGAVANFGTIVFTEPGNYVYTVTEAAVLTDAQKEQNLTTLPGVTNDAQAETGKTVTISVVDNGNGTMSLTSSVSGENPLSFTNTYEATPTTAVVDFEKVLEKQFNNLTAPSIANAYEFVLAAGDCTPADGYALPTATTKTIGGATGGSSSFDAITFTKVGIYKFTVTERNTVQGIVNDEDTVRDVTVTVTDNGEGALVAEVEYENGKADIAKFTNTYKVEPTYAEVKVKKTVDTGVFDGFDATTVAGEFTFTLEAKGHTYLPENAVDGKVTVDTIGALVSELTFGSIAFDRPGTYEYTVTESGDMDGVENDRNLERTVTIDVTDNSNGTLTAVVKQGEVQNDVVEYTNTYSAEPTTITIPVVKSLQVPAGVQAPDIAGKYNFTISSTDTTAPLPMADGVVANVLVYDGQNAMEYAPITFVKPGTYVYTITEGLVGEPVPGVTTDGAKTVSVDVKDNGTGELYIDWDSEYTNIEDGQSIVFKNTYKVDETEIILTVSKTLELNGLTGPDSIDKLFTFTLKAVGDAPQPTDQVLQIENNGTGSVSFGKIEFTTPGTYVYEITESGTYDYIENDAEATKTVTVTVTDNNNGTLTATSDASNNTVNFTNTYVVDDVEVSVPVEKVLELNGLTGPESIAKAFTFTLTGENAEGQTGAVPMPAETSKKNPDANGGTVTFGPIIFSTVGIWNYTITESGEVDGVTNDDEAKTFTVKVTDNKNGTLNAEVTGLTNGQLTFVNEYDVGDTGYQIPVDKTVAFAEELNGPEAVEDAFTFTLTRHADNPTAPLPEDCTVTVSSTGGSVSFGEIPFTAPGTYKYEVTESGDVDGVTNDTDATKLVTIEVTDKGNGELEVIADYEGEAESVTFTNTYEAGPTEAVVPVLKTLKVRTGEAAASIKDKFTFTLTAAENCPEGYDLSAATPITNPDANGGEAKFGAIKFSKPGTYTFVITESRSNPAQTEADDGITVDAEPKTVTIEIADNGKGQLVVVAEESNYQSTQFINYYDVDETETTVSITKVLETNGLTPDSIAGDFTFTLAAAEGSRATGYALSAPTVVTNPDDNGGSAQFGKITFTEAGTYTFTVTEGVAANAEVGGITNDTEPVKTVTVNVVDNGYGKLVVTTAETDRSVTFTNTYNITEPASIKFPVKKVLEVPENQDVASIKEKFTFTMVPVNNAPMPKDADGNMIASEAVKNPDDNGGTAWFSAIEYTAAGTYVYDITESGSASGVHNDTISTKQVTVTVTDNGNGTLSAVANSTEATPVTFTNRYEHGEVTINVPVEKELEMAKGLTGPDIKEKFTFTMVPVDNAPMPKDADGKELTEATVKNPAANGGTGSFPAIKYTEPGIYEYTITETGTVDGIVNDTATRTVTVTVSDDGEGHMTANVTGNDGSGAKFINKYQVKPIELSIPVEKVLQGKINGLTLPTIAGEFTFTITGKVVSGKADTAPMPKVSSITNEGESMSFTGMKFTLPGVYEYTIKETGTVNGVTNDSDKTVTITVTDNKDGTLAHTIVCGNTNNAVFTNTYMPKATELVIPVEKTLKIASGVGPTEDVDDTFTFTLKALNGAPMPETVEETTVSVPLKGGNGTFGKIVYDKPGTYAYTIEETGTAAGVENAADQTVYVVVTDNGSGQLAAELMDSNDAETATVLSKVAFENTYNATPDTLSIEVDKKLQGAQDGLELPDIKGKFTFTITGSENAPMPAVKSYTYKGSPMKFGEIEFKTVGEFTYTITETGLMPGVSNAAAKTVTVKVTDDGMGKLKAVATSTEGTNLTFINTYNTKEIDHKIPVLKTLSVPAGETGPDIKSKFTFTLKARNGAPMPTGAVNGVITATNGDGGLVDFGTITYTKPGTFLYEVTESGEVTGVQNDTATKTVTVTVTDMSDGTMTVSCSHDADNPVTFTNTYDAENAQATIPVKKLFEKEFDNLVLPNVLNMYTFVLTADTANPEGCTMPTVTSLTNPADGEMSFGPFTFSKEGTYKFTVTESGSVTGIQNDADNTRDVTITVKDDKAGKLIAVVTTDDDAVATFKNRYEVEDTTAELNVKKTIAVNSGVGPALSDIENAFTFTLAAKDNAPLPKDELGNEVTELKTTAALVSDLSFGTFTFDKPGTYKYTVTESGSMDGVTNDADLERDVEIVVTDNSNGTMSAVVNEGDNTIAYTNTYNAEPTYFSIPVEKVLEAGKDNLTLPNIKEAYTFTLTASEGTPMPQKTEYKNPTATGGVVTFGEIKYTEPGTYTYTITETGTVAGVSNDGSKSVTVVVKDDGEGNLYIDKDATTLKDNTNVIFTNTYTTGSAEITLSAKKVLTVGENLKGPDITGMFTFTLAAAEADTPMPTTDTQLTNPASNGGTVNFGKIVYDEVGEYKYTITESGEYDYILNDVNNVRNITVTVKDMGNGTMVAECSEEGNTVTFTNTYKVVNAEIYVPVIKTLAFDEDKDLTPNDINGKFDFVLSSEDTGAPMPAVTTLTYTEDETGAQVPMSFGPIKYSHEGTYEYTITESVTDGSEKVPGITNDSPKTFTVTVTDNKEGELEAVVTGLTDNEATFVNTYDVEPTEAVIPVQKTIQVPEDLDGLKEDKTFTFHLSAVNGGPLPAETSVEISVKDGTESAEFGKIKFEKPGDYQYKIVETADVDGITNDAEAATGKLVNVKVVDNGNGTLTATVDKTGDNTVTFTNTYGVEPTTVQFPVKKQLEVPAGLDANSIQGKFTFTLTAEDGAPLPEKSSFQNPDEDGGTVTFEGFTFDKPGTYKYTITESVTDGSEKVPGITNDAVNPKVVTVTVVDNGNGTLTATASSTTDAPLTFINSYDTDHCVENITITKVLEYANYLEPAEIEDKFTFTLVPVSENAPMPAAGEEVKTNPANGKVTFGDITFTAPGTYEYKVTEAVTEGANVGGITNDAEAVTGKTVTIRVKDDGNGKLYADKDESNLTSVTFTNKYEAGPTTAVIPVKKILSIISGTAPSDITGKFTFTLTADENNQEGATLPTVTTVTNTTAEGGDNAFDAINFSKPGTYKFYVAESVTPGFEEQVGGLSVASTIVPVTIKVADNGLGQLVATVETYSDENPVTFTNEYRVQPTTVSFPIEKVVDAAVGLTAPDITGRFSFTLTAVDGAPLPDTISYTNPDSDGGEVTFGPITYQAPGTYTYKIAESVTQNMTADGFSLAGEETVTVVVTDNGDGSMTATASSTDSNRTTFTNTYSVTPATASFPVKKVLTVPAGLEGPDSIKEAFKFTLTAVTEGAPMPKDAEGNEVTELWNPEEKGGTVTFGTFTFTKPGAYEYNVTETGTVPGVQNDIQSVKPVTITVVDNKNGTLTATANYTEDAPLTFTNTYGVKPTKASFPVEKLLSVATGLNAPDITDKFTFKLTAADGTPMPETTEYTNPDADGGVVTFGEIEYTMPDTYIYTITEEGQVDGITNDGTASKTVTVTVVDQKDGTLKATADSTTDAPLTFTNTYTVKPTTAKIPVKKLVETAEGLKVGDITGKFTFTLTAVTAGAPLPSVTELKTPAADGGLMTFGNIEFTAPGNYAYTVTETGSFGGVTNDPMDVKAVTIDVVDNSNGTMTATVSCTDENPLTFKNTYAVEPTTASFPVKKELKTNGLTPNSIEGKFTFTLTALNGAPEARDEQGNTVTVLTNPDADGGVVTFGTFTFDKPGTYSYEVTETGTVPGITNDQTATKPVTITVVDNGNGTLTATASSTAESPLTFVNEYAAEKVTVSFPVVKELSVAEGLTPDSIEGKFTFTLAALDGAPLPKDAEGNDVTVLTNPDADGGEMIFGTFTYEEPGIYEYTITESVTDGSDKVPGITNDAEATKNVTVTVTDNGEGKLVATTTSTDVAPLTFTNTYTVEPTTASFPVVKTLVHTDDLTPDSIEGKFTFTLQAQNNAPVPAEVEKSNPDADGGKVTFGDITYTEPGTYVYTITESGAADGVTNDPVVAKNVTVTVVDNGNGTLTATADSTDDEPLTFENTYTVQPTKTSFPVKKILTVDEGLTAPDITGKFTFTLTAVDGAPMPADKVSVTNPVSDGGIEYFGEIEYTKPGTYTYTITETGEVDGITNDAADKTVTVTVTDNGDGTLTAVADSTADAPATFENTYTVAPTEISFPVEKVLEAAEGLAPADITGKFTFTLTAAEGVPMPETTVYTNPDANGGKVTFGAIAYTEPGIYEYTVTETGSVPGITNDAESAKKVTVTVVDNSNGTMTATADYNDENVLTFVNTYTVAPTTASIPVEKLLTVDEGDTAPDITGKFSFELAAVDGAPLPATIRYTNPLADGGKVTFGEITYTEPGIYSYTITETGSVTGIVNDAQATKTVTVTVVDNGDGTLTATADATAEAPVTFTNSYEVVDINVQKVWNDDSNRSGKRPESIKVQLVADDENVGEAVELNDANSWKTEWKQLPRYNSENVAIVYTVKEIVDEATLAEYKVEVGYVWDSEGNGTVTVTNTNEAAVVEITGTKIWDDIDDKYLKRPDSVTIHLFADGVEIDKMTVTEAEDWTWTFTGLPKYKEGAVGQEIVYTITEDAVTGYITTVEDYNVRNTLNLVEFIKLDEQTGKRLPGAKFALYEGGLETVDQSAPVETWVSDKGTKILAGLKVGQTYTIIETEAPSGYAMMTPFVFTVELNDIPGTYRSFSVGNCHVYRFRKLDSSNNGLVEGAKLAVMDGDTVIESWTTSVDNNGWYEIADVRLSAGVTYTLVEQEAPFGYEVAEPISFTINENDGMLVVNGVVTGSADVVMYDAPVPEVTPTPEPTSMAFSVTKRWEDKNNVLGKRPNSITVHLYRKLATDEAYPTIPYMTVNIMGNEKNQWRFVFRGVPLRNSDGVRYSYMIREEEVPGYVTTYLNGGRTIVNSIPEEDYPPTPTPTLPYITPTPTVQPRIPQGVRFENGEWYYIDEYGIPLGGVPLTGDNTNFILWGMAIGLPLLVAVLAAVEIRRRKKLLVAAEQDEEADEADE